MRTNVGYTQNILGQLSETSQTLIAIVFVIIFLIIARYTIKLKKRRAKKWESKSPEIPFSKMLNYSKFNTAEGFCYIMETHLVLTDHSDPKEILRRKSTDIMPVLRATLLFLSYVGYAYVGYAFFLGLNFNIYLLAGIPILLLLIYYRIRSKSKLNIIAREKIQGLYLKKSWLKNSFVVHFKNDKGKIMDRYIPMKNNMEDINLAFKMLLKSKVITNTKNQDLYNSLQSQLIKKMTSGSKGASATAVDYSKKETEYKRSKDGYLKDY